MRFIPLIAVILLATLGGCRKPLRITGPIDQAAFDHLGGTIFSDPEQITIKEVQLDNGVRLGQEIIIEGTVLSIGKYDTHLIVQDKTGQLLIVLTRLNPPAIMIPGFSPKQIRVLGTLERGNRGLPYIMARSINIPTGANGA